jgi:AAA15 family ATPase/GTPase
MLVEFNITNFRSIKEKVTLSMVAAKTKEEEHPENTFKVEGRNLTLLKSAVLYGANASGKSNIIKAFTFMCNFVLDSATKLKPDDLVTGVIPFKLSQDCLKKPSTFEVTFIQGSESFTYGFSLTSQKIHKEWLYAARKNRQRILFERDNTKRNETYHFGDSWKGEKKPLQDRTRQNALFLSVAHQFNNQDVAQVVSWFANNCRWILDDSLLHSELNHTIRLLSKSGTLKSSVEKLLKVADLGIEAIDIQKYPMIEDPELLKLPDKARMDMLSQIPEDARKGLEVVRINFTHKSQDLPDEDKKVTFDMMNEESRGTLTFFSLLGPWFSTLNDGLVLFIDEFEGSLHPHLSRFLIQSLHDFIPKGNHPQLVFSTHDTSFLDSELFRRDQIWFTEKAEDGSTKLYSLWDMKPRTTENFRSGYLKGRYGAIPFIDDSELENEEKRKIRK